MGDLYSPITMKIEDAICSLVSKPSMRCAWYVDADLIIAAIDGSGVPVDLEDNVQDNSGHGRVYSRIEIQNGWTLEQHQQYA